MYHISILSTAILILVIHEDIIYSAGFAGIRGVQLNRDHIIRLSSNDQHHQSIKLPEGRSLFIVTEDAAVATGQKGSDYFAVLSSKTRDRSLLNDAITNLMRDKEFLGKSNSLSLVSEALKNCKVPPHLMFYFWREMYYLGVQIKKQDVKDLLFYCYKFDKRDSNTLQNALDLITTLNKTKYWNSAVFNLIIQLYTEKSDSIYNKSNIVQEGITLSDIVMDLLNMKDENNGIIDEKSIVMLLKYFSSIGDYYTLQIVFSYRNKVTKRHLKAAVQEDKFDIDDENENKNENSIIWNAYLSAIIKFLSSYKTLHNNRNESGSEEQNKYLKELNSSLEKMIELKIADLYTQNIMLTYYSVLMNNNNNDNDNNDNNSNNDDYNDNHNVNNNNLQNKLHIKKEELIKKCLALWNNKYLMKLRENEINNIPFDNISVGVKISYALIIKCLLSNVECTNNVSNIDSINNYHENIDDNNNKNNKNNENNKHIRSQKYIKEAFHFCLQLPTEEVISSFLYSLGTSHEKIRTSLGCLKLLNEKQLLMKNRIVDNYQLLEDFDNSKTEDKSENKDDGYNREIKHINDNSINYLESLLSGYYNALRYDLVIEVYLISYENIKDDNSNIYNDKNFIEKDFNVLSPSKLNKNGNTKTFNLFLASIKETLKNNLEIENDTLTNKKSSRNNNEIISNKKKAFYYKNLWEFTKFLLRERISVERMIQNEKKYVKGSINIKNELFTPLLDSYTTATAIDCCNLFNDNKLSNELFYYQYKILSYSMSVPTQRVVQSFLRSFQSSTQLYELDKFVKSILLISPKYNYQFSGNSDKKNSEETRTFDEIINSYLRCGNLPIALEIASMKAFNGFSDIVLRNLLIYFDRYWRDYDSESIYINDLLRGL